MAYLVLILLLADARQSFEGKVVSVHDGDTITDLQFEGIGAPESKQTFGTKARQALSKKAFGKKVKVEWNEKDLYDRVLGTVMLDKRWINNEMVQDGIAWHYKRYSNDRTLLASED